MPVGTMASPGVVVSERGMPSSYSDALDVLEVDPRAPMLSRVGNPLLRQPL